MNILKVIFSEKSLVIIVTQIYALKFLFFTNFKEEYEALKALAAFLLIVLMIIYLIAKAEQERKNNASK